MAENSVRPIPGDCQNREFSKGSFRPNADIRVSRYPSRREGPRIPLSSLDLAVPTAVIIGLPVVVIVLNRWRPRAGGLLLAGFSASS